MTVSTSQSNENRESLGGIQAGIVQFLLNNKSPEICDNAKFLCKRFYYCFLRAFAADFKFETGYDFILSRKNLLDN